MEVSLLQQEQPSSEEQMQQKNISSLFSLLARQHKSHIYSPLLLMTCDRIFGTTCAIFWTRA
jgi:hypothetical protein